ncbi:MAG: hypothetical protein GY825_01925 [Phycisphaeraceae bacterium]|nr:hypothetical protein [Phycisphaeraceae bacterium]MCP4495515.1 hypothetical protein [Phycisphaeraceae bacterium]
MTWASIFLIFIGIAIGVLGLALLVTVMVTGFLAFARRDSARPIEGDATISVR